jgi:CHAT domain-containing protein
MAMWLLAGCGGGMDNRDELTLQEAKALSAEFQKQPFTPPPRTVDDVMEKLGADKPVPADCAARQAATSTANDDWVGDADTSRSSKARDDMYKAMESFYDGDYRRSIRYAERAAAVVPSNWGFAQSRMYFALSRYYAYTGDFSSANAAYRQGATAGRVRYAFNRQTTATMNFQRDSVEAHALVAEAAMAQLQGKYRLGEMRYRNILENYPAGLSAYINLQLVTLDLANTLAHQGRYAEAESHVRDVLKIGYIDSPYTAYYLLQLARIVHAQGRDQDAEKLVRRAIRMYEVTCAPPGSINLALARQLLAEILVARGEWEAALREFQIIESRVAASAEEIFERKFRYNIDWSLAYLNSGQPRIAVTRLDDTARYLEGRYGAGHYSVAEAKALHALALARNGDYEAAMREMREALPRILEHLRELDAAKEGRTSRDRRAIEILEGYMALLMEIRGTPIESSYSVDPVTETFALAQIAGSGSVQQALAASSARAAGKDPALADLARREQDSRRQLGALSDRLDFQLSLASEDQDPQAIDSLKDQIAKLKKLHDALMEEIEDAFPDYMEIIRPRAITLTDLQAALAPDEAIVSIYTARRHTYVWTVPVSGAPAAHVVAIDRHQLAHTVAVLRRALDPSALTLAEIPRFDLERAYDLYRQLLEPSKSTWTNARNLIVIAYGPMGQLPIGLLPTARTTLAKAKAPLFSNYRSVPWLARSHAITVLPATASLGTLRRLPAGQSERRAFAGFGDPVFDRAPTTSEQPPVERYVAAVNVRGTTPAGQLTLSRRAAPTTRNASSAEIGALPSLPETADEVRAIAKALDADPATDIYLGENASEAKVKAMTLSDRRVLAFATHGLVPGDLNGLTQPALALSAPGPGEEEDGLLTMGEILGLELDADWVVLSACNTAAADGTGAEAVSGLGRAFFYAGARSLLVSNWPVETTSAKALTTGIFERQAADPSLSRAEALQQAMLGLIDEGGYVDEQGRMLFSYAHPIFWAPFSLVGDGGKSH